MIVESPYAILIVFVLGIVLKEVKDSHGRGKIHKRIDALDKTYVRRDICHERTDRLHDDLTEVKEDIKELLRRNGGERK